jgi:hypothetical protein
MPIARYFLFVGGVLLALLLAVNAVQPQLPVANADITSAAVDRSVIRIHSDRKWPERVVFDTSLPTIVPVQAAKAEAVVPPPTPVADVPVTARVRDTFAQVVPPEPKKAEPKPQRKRKIAKSRAAPPAMLVAQQPRFGFFANNTGFFGNNTW